MAKKNYYDILGVDRTATDVEIKQAYRKKAIKYHPDKNPGDKLAEDKFKEATEAYETLKDSSKRANYDMFGHTSQGPAFGNGPNQNGDFYPGGFSSSFNGFNAHFDFSSFFEKSIYEKIRRTRYKYDTAEKTKIVVQLNTELKDSFEKYKKKFSYERRERCQTCIGKEGTKENCRLCGGKKSFMVCPHCGGKGYVTRVNCNVCGGQKLVQKQKTIEITIPKGVRTGNTLTLKGMGHEVVDGSPGDLLVTIVEQPHPVFKREGNDLSTKKSISFPEAALGTALLIDVLGHKTIKFKVRPGIQSGAKLRIPGEGMYIPGTDRRGDLIITIIVVTPTNLSDQQREILEKLRGIESKHA